ncbi:hypothetical protein HYQ43_01310 [Paracoccus pantotrophus]|uniref:Lipoprotein n=1 Tax=Paracoccus pantotrophus TaxID=82367 RepID=A0A7H9BQA0_PARPN|nr:hypothetical protein [Paracoccus pantotrophus]QLH12975.1 hypothetical protein HYQ43_01310 [Paracoccus pantotrophus]
MIFSKPVFILGVMLIGLSACDTPEYRAERSHCEAEWMLKFPPDYQQGIVTKYRNEERPTGAMECVTEGSKTQCTPKTETVSVPYTALEVVDIRKPQRDSQIQSCAIRACQMKYGNVKCEA